MWRILARPFEPLELRTTTAIVGFPSDDAEDGQVVVSTPGPVAIRSDGAPIVHLEKLIFAGGGVELTNGELFSLSNVGVFSVTNDSSTTNGDALVGVHLRDVAQRGALLGVGVASVRGKGVDAVGVRIDNCTNCLLFDVGVAEVLAETAGEERGSAKGIELVNSAELAMTSVAVAEVMSLEGAANPPPNVGLIVEDVDELLAGTVFVNVVQSTGPGDSFGVRLLGETVSVFDGLYVANIRGGGGVQFSGGDATGVELEGNYAIAHLGVAGVIAGSGSRRGAARGVAMGGPGVIDFFSIWFVDGQLSSGVHVTSPGTRLRHGIVSRVSRGALSQSCIGLADQLDDGVMVDFVLAHDCEVGSFALLQGDPLFANPQEGDLSLQPGSPAIDAGSSATDDYAEEPEPNGCRANLGLFGNTPEAALSSSEECPD